MATAASAAGPSNDDDEYDKELPGPKEKEGFLDVQSDHKWFKRPRYWITLLENIMFFSRAAEPKDKWYLASLSDMEMKPLDEPNERSFVIKSEEFNVVLTAESKEERDEWVSAIMLNFVNLWIRTMTVRWCQSGMTSPEQPFARGVETDEFREHVFI